MTIKAIETRYKGYRFRSRLEARWAVWLDTLGLAWEYEKQGYDLPSGPYLPDFWVPIVIFDHAPGAGYWVEIKPFMPSEEELGLFAELSLFTGHNGYLLHGNVGVGEFEVIKSVCVRTQKHLDLVRTGGYGAFRVRTHPQAPHLAGILFSYDKPRDAWGASVCLSNLITMSPAHADVEVCFSAARAARFEHGECPPP
jgi:hypothetical protein